jgi:hypothetical protein
LVVSRRGGLAEWPMAAVLKTAEAQVSGGSNPSPSAPPDLQFRRKPAGQQPFGRFPKPLVQVEQASSRQRFETTKSDPPRGIYGVVATPA